MYQYILNFTTPVHFGLEGIGQERIDDRVRSDTLWGAIIQTWFLLYDEEPDTFCLSPPFQVSSTFPFISGRSYYPLPLGTLDELISEVAGMESGLLRVKDLKKIRFIEENLFMKIVTGYRLVLDDITRSGAVYPAPGTDQAGDRDRAFSLEQRPRLGTNQITGGGIEGAFFYCSDQYFPAENGLWFLADFNNDKARQRFEAALRLLGDTGIGADRSVGRGQFSFIVSDLKLNIPKGDVYLLLSLYHPTREEVGNGVLDSAGSAYSLNRRSGYAASRSTTSFRRRDIWMLEEGAILPFRPTGDISVVLKKSAKVPHNIYRCGLAFCLPMLTGKSREVTS
jgi:CRISPR-associated protein Csm4